MAVSTKCVKSRIIRCLKGKGMKKVLLVIGDAAEVLTMYPWQDNPAFMREFMKLLKGRL